LAKRDEKVLRFYGEAYRYRAYAGNLTLSKQDETSESVLWQAMDQLEAGAGDAINKYASETGVHLVPYSADIEIR
jgi:hypothetical protein